MAKITKSIKNRFWELVTIPLEVNACWIWEGTKRPDGYGVMFFNSSYERAHRLAYKLEVTVCSVHNY